MDESEVRLREILDILLYVGYFRVRIPSLSTFDKLLGGLVWCISCSNFEIDVSYNDEMTMGQKIKLCEKIVSALAKMNCPYKIQPHQIHGLDFPNLHPIFQWLIRFVLETRDQRQDITKNMSSHLGNRLLIREGTDKRAALVGAVLEQSKSDSRRVTKNTKIEMLGQLDPLRVYSSLIEYDEKTAFRTYNRLCSLYSSSAAIDFPLKKKELGEVKRAGHTNAAASASKPVDVLQVFAEDGEAEGDKLVGEMKEFTRINERKTSSVGQNLYKIVSANREKLSENIKSLGIRDEKFELAALLKNEEAFFVEEKESILKNTDALRKKIVDVNQQVSELGNEIVTLDNQAKEFREMEGKLITTRSNIETRLNEKRKQMPYSVYNGIHTLIEKKNGLKADRALLRKEARTQIASFDEEKGRLEAEMPTFDERVYDDMAKKYQRVKERYDEKFKDYALLNQEIAIMQRKIENYPSTVETAQYHQRFIELYEKINFEMEKYRDNYVSFNNKQDYRSTLLSQIETMKSFKEGLVSAKTSKEREEFVKNIQNALQGFQAHLTKIEGYCKNVRSTREKNLETYANLLSLERQYYSVVKALQIELEKNEVLNSNEA
eukprot:TRINITY_DN12299_c0_g1_i1.p1 TRINITY_DN12299_c0_g1~~TRINITY_DN12299_c0_g1_i1.p1  ORF type:complete len:605 (-),score=185.63 TRINITY_DN12299_c0_g1_i1:130-1944(-)